MPEKSLKVFLDENKVKSDCNLTFKCLYCSGNCSEKSNFG